MESPIVAMRFRQVWAGRELVMRDGYRLGRMRAAEAG